MNVLILLSNFSVVGEGLRNDGGSSSSEEGGSSSDENTSISKGPHFIIPTLRNHTGKYYQVIPPHWEGRRKGIYI